MAKPPRRWITLGAARACVVAKFECDPVGAEEWLREKIGDGTIGLRDAKDISRPVTLRDYEINWERSKIIKSGLRQTHVITEDETDGAFEQYTDCRPVCLDGDALKKLISLPPEQLEPTGPPKKSPGAPQKWDWDGVAVPCVIEMALHPDGLPPKQHKIEDRIKESFVNKCDDHPSVTSIRGKLSKWLPEVYRRDQTG